MCNFSSAMWWFWAGCDGMVFSQPGGFLCYQVAMVCTLGILKSTHNCFLGGIVGSDLRLELGGSGGMLLED